ncbi:hydrogenase maturation protease [candidate division WOR-3 bacterium]|nr:hydrogenase maturation protease [candidate division WOR-3 bacterium]
MKTLVLGLGNTIRSDDGVGVQVIRELAQGLGPDPDVEFKEGSVGGLAILDEIAGFDRLVLVDSIKTSGGNPGDLYKLSEEDFNTSVHLSNSHGVDFATAVELGRRFGYKIPARIEIYAVEVDDNTTFKHSCTARVRERIPQIVQTIKGELTCQPIR